MKKILFTISLLLSWFATSCNNEEMDAPLMDNEMVELTFSVDIPEMQVASRAFSGDNKVSNVTSLQLLVFDATSGMMIACPTADISTQSGDTETLKYYEVTLPKMAEPCIIHFVANAALVAAQLGTEEKILSQVNVQEETGAYWNRITVNGIDDKTTLGHVSLIRNFACIEVIDGTGTNGADGGFLEGFILVNEPNSGTVAPYFGGSTLGFADFDSYLSATGNESTYTKVTNHYIGIEPVNNTYNGNVSDTEEFKEDSKYIYERTYGDLTNVQSPTYVVVKGKFDADKNGTVEDDEVFYYRVDIAENTKNLHLIRNFKYKVIIQSVTEKGYDSPTAAAGGSSFNNLVNVDIRVERVSDGTNTLKVSPTDVTVVYGESNIVEFDYEFTGSAGTNVWAEWASGNVFTNVELNKNNGKITATLKSYPDNQVEGSKQSQTFEVRGGTPSNYVSRTININLINRVNFNVSATKNDDENYSLDITIPSGLFKSMFPLEIIISEVNSNTQSIFCTFTPIVGQTYPMEIVSISKPITDNENTQVWGYKLTIPWSKYIQTEMTVKAQFKANSKFTGNKYLKVENKYATTVIQTVSSN